MRIVRAGLESTGGLGALDERARRSRRALWLRSLLAIYDVADLTRLDVPWWTFEAADLVEAHLRQSVSPRVFEWGSGASTVWLARRGAAVTSVEHDQRWAEAVRAQVPESAQVDLRVVPGVQVESADDAVRSGKRGFEGIDFTAYADEIERAEGPFDLIIVDGRAREYCLRTALPHLAPAGVLVFDDVERTRYRRAIHALASTEIDVQWTRGFGPCIPYPTGTALIRRRNAP